MFLIITSNGIKVLLNYKTRHCLSRKFPFTVCNMRLNNAIIIIQQNNILRICRSETKYETEKFLVLEGKYKYLVLNIKNL